MLADSESMDGGEAVWSCGIRIMRLRVWIVLSSLGRQFLSVCVSYLACWAYCSFL